MRYHKRTDKFFSKKERERIKEVTANVEMETIGEIAVVVVDNSSFYREAEILGAVLAGSFVSLIVTEILFHTSEKIAEFFFYSTMWFFIPLAIIIFFPMKILFKKNPSFKIVFVSKKRKEKSVQKRALQAFYENGLYKTKHNTGVLFFISLIERKVWVLADKGINEKVEQKTLNRLANIVSKGIKDGCACDALCEAIVETGKMLSEHFPSVPEDINELPNGIIFDSGKSTG